MSGYQPRPGRPQLQPLSDQLLAFLRSGLRVNFPPPGFNPVTADDDRLRQFFLPPRPDQKLARRAYDIWQFVMSRPLVWPQIPADREVIAEDVLRTLFAESPLRSQPRLAVAATEEASGNWSGTYVRPRDLGTIALVQGVWTVPQPLAPSPQPDTYASSAWIGLDGHEPASRSMPQIGTAQWVTLDAAGATEELYAWWQWWVRDAPQNGHVVINAVPVKAGNQIYAQVQRIDDVTASMFIINLSSNVAFPFWFGIKSPTQPFVHGPNPLFAHVEGRTAEWIMERPQHLDSNEFYQLPNYQQITFGQCNGLSLLPHQSTDTDLSYARLVRMAVWDAANGQVPGRVVSRPRRSGNRSIVVDYIV